MLNRNLLDLVFVSYSYLTVDLQVAKQPPA